MSSLLQQLENNEAVLLMYLCGELPEEDRAEVEQLLAGDVGLARELERLRSTYGGCIEAIERLDDGQRIRTAPAQRHALRSVRQWNLARQVPVEPEPEVEVVSRRWWLTYPVSAAAAILIGLAVWWSYTPVEQQVGPLVAERGIYQDRAQLWERMESAPLVQAEQELLRLSLLDDEPLFPFFELMEETTN